MTVSWSQIGQLRERGVRVSLALDGHTVNVGPRRRMDPITHRAIWWAIDTIRAELLAEANPPPVAEVQNSAPIPEPANQSATEPPPLSPIDWRILALVESAKETRYQAASMFWAKELRGMGEGSAGRLLDHLERNLAEEPRLLASLTFNGKRGEA